MDSCYLCPIYFFEYDGERIDLPDQLQIIKIPQKFVEYLDNKYPTSLPTILSEVKWTIALKITNIDTTNMTPIESISIGLRQEEDIKNKLLDLITSLRLFKKGRIVAGLLTFATFQNSEWHIGGTTSWTSVSNLIFFKEDPIYKLKQSELTKFITLFQQTRQYHASNVISKIEIALDRFHSSYHGNIEDRIIDQMIAFESLYLGYEQELTYKLAMRTAFLLRNRTDFRNIVFNNMKKAYNFRSRIVHGENPPPRKTLGVVVSKTDDYLRQSIVRFLELLSQGESLKNIREKLLDENILKNGRTLTVI
jgi:hypothetical protein